MRSDVHEGAYPNLEAMGRMAINREAGVPIDFEFGLHLILDGLERLLPTPATPTRVRKATLPP